MCWIVEYEGFETGGIECMRTVRKVEQSVDAVFVIFVAKRTQ